MMKLPRLSEVLALRRSLIGLLLTVVLLGLGEKMTERFIPVYLLALGGGNLAIGIFQGLTNALGALYSYPAGYLADRFGAKRSLLWFNILAILGYGVALVFPYWQAALAGAVLFLAWSAVSMPASMKLIAEALPENRRTMGVSLHSLVRRFPMAIGPILGGSLVACLGETNGIRAGFFLAIIAAFGGIFFQQKLISPEAKNKETSLAKLGRFSDFSPALRTLLYSDILVRFCEQIPYAFVVVWCLKTIAQPVTPTQFGVLTAIEMLVAVLCYIPVALLADRHGKQPYVTTTFIFFSAFPLILLFSTSFETLVIAFVIRGLKEFGEPTRKALILDLCPPEKKGAVFGLYYFARDLLATLGALAGAVLWSWSPQANLVVAAMCGLLGTVLFAALSRAHQPTNKP